MRAKLNAGGQWLMLVGLCVALAVGAREAYAARPSAMRSCVPAAIGTCTDQQDSHNQCVALGFTDGTCSNGCCFCLQ